MDNTAHWETLTCRSRRSPLASSSGTTALGQQTSHACWAIWHRPWHVFVVRVTFGVIFQGCSFIIVSDISWYISLLGSYKRLALSPLSQTISIHCQGVFCPESMKIKRAFTISPQLLLTGKASLGRGPTAHPNGTVFSAFIPYWGENCNSVWR